MPARLIGGVILGGWTLLLAPLLVAEPIRFSVSQTIATTDNATSSVTDPVSDTLSLTGFDVTHQVSKSRLNARLQARTVFETYLNETYGDEFTNQVRFNGNYQFSPRLRWNLDEKLSDVERDSLRPNTPDNRTRLNILKTGPAASFRWGDRSRTDLSADYINVDYLSESTRSDRGRAVLRHDLVWRPTWDTGFEAVGEAARIEDEAVFTDTRRVVGSLVVGQSMRRHMWLLKSGYTWFDREQGGRQSQEDGLTAQLLWESGKGERLSFEGELARELSDSASDVVLDNFGDLRAVDIIDTVVQDRFLLKSRYRVDGNDRLELGYSIIEDEYKTQNIVQREQNFGVTWEHDHSATVSSTFAFAHEDFQYEGIDGDSKSYGWRYDLTYRWMKNLQVAAFVDYTDGVVYQVTELGVTMRWLPRR